MRLDNVHAKLCQLDSLFVLLHAVLIFSLLYHRLPFIVDIKVAKESATERTAPGV